MGEIESQTPDGVENREVEESAFVEDVQGAAGRHHINSAEMKRILERLWSESSSNPDTWETKEQGK